MSSILVVCTANVCRSPLGEFVLRETLDGALGRGTISVSSAGIKAQAGAAVCASSAAFAAPSETLVRRGEHRSRPVQASDIEAAQLVLAATRRMRSALVTMSPALRSRVFTIREAAWLGANYEGLCTGAPGSADPIEAFAAHLNSQRGIRAEPRTRRGLWRTKSHPFDIADGHGERPGLHNRALLEVDQSARSLAALIAKGATAP